MSETSKAVFLSYASQDTEEVRGIAEALRAAGVEVWFDQNELVGGDAWDAKIRKQIAECALFVPMISANTQARLEGYFRLEWKLAAQRTHTMAEEKAFLLPVVIDATRDPEAVVPAEFKAVQWTRLPEGESPEKFCAQVKKILGREGPAVVPVPVADAIPGRRSGRPAMRSHGWLAPVMIGAIGVVTAAFWYSRQEKDEPAVSTPAAMTPAAPISAARQQVERARTILDQSVRSRANLEAAEEIMRRALALDPTDAEVWAMAARVDAGLYQIYDRSAARREQLLQRSAKAVALAPNEWETRHIRAWAFTVASDDASAMLLEAEKIYRQLLLERPGDKRATNALAEAMKGLRRFEEAAELFERTGNLYSAGWAYVSARQYGAARTLAEREIAKAPTAGMLKLKIYVEAYGFEDLDAAQAASNRFTAADLMDDENVAEAVRLAVYRRDPVEILRLMKVFPSEKIDSVIFRGSKHIYIGAAHSIAGRVEAAQSEWRIALKQTEAQLKISPSDSATLQVAADLQALLGEKEAARSLLRQARSLAGRDPDAIGTMADVQTEITLGQLEEAMAWFLARKRDSVMIPYNYRLDPLRGDPRFEKMLRDMPARAKPVSEVGTVPTATTGKTK